MTQTLRLSIHSGQSGHKSLNALVAFAPGDSLSAFQGITRPRPTRHSLQVGVSEHILLEPEILRYINHSCDPNIVFDVLRRTVRAIRPIAPGEEIVYFYPSTEWDMAEPFFCICGAAHCLRRIQGAAHLPPDVLARYELQPHIQDQLMPRINAPQTDLAATLGNSKFV